MLETYLYLQQLTSLMHQLKNSYFADVGSSSKAGMMDYLLTNKPRYLLVDEIDKMTCRDQIFLLNLMETGIVSETKSGKTRSAQMITSVFAKNILAHFFCNFTVVAYFPFQFSNFKFRRASCSIPMESPFLIVYKPLNILLSERLK
jgi:hypothetical protein